MLSLILIKNPECANSYHENLPNRILNRCFELNSVENKMQLDPKAQAVNKAQRKLRPEPYFSEFFKSRAQLKHDCGLCPTFFIRHRFKGYFC